MTAIKPDRNISHTPGRRRALRAALVLGLAPALLAGGPASPATALTKRQKAAGRKALLREVRRNPRAVFRRGFLRRASLFDFDLPLTLRLNPATDATPTFAPTDDQVQLDFGTALTGAPLPAGRFPGVVASALGGRIHATMRFGQDTTGYGRPGIIELGFGDMDLAAGPGLSLIDFDPACGDGPRLKTGPVSVIEATGTNGESSGYVDLYRGEVSLDLRTRWRFNSLARSTCGGGFSWTYAMTGAGDPPLPLVLDGKFRMTPAITADGQLRLGRVTVDDTVTPQNSSAVSLHSCTVERVPEPPGPAPSTTCDGQAEDVVLPGRLKAIHFTAELLVGSLAS